MNPYTPLIRLCARAHPETLGRNHVTKHHMATFFKLARMHGMADARAWLLGRILLDSYSETDPTPLPLQQDPQSAPPDVQPTSSPRERLQQHIESAARHVDTEHPPL